MAECNQNILMKEKIPTNISSQDLHTWLLEKNCDLFLIDVREDQELAIAPFPFTNLHLPLSRSSEWLDALPNLINKDQPVLIICHRGIRSWNFGSWLLQQGLLYEVWNLDGGIESWSLNVDPTIPCY